MIICDVCKKNEVVENGQRCEDCQGILQTELAEDRENITGAYLPDDLYEKYAALDRKIKQSDIKAKGLFGKMMSALRTSFLNPEGKLILNPVPDKVCLRESSMDRVERFIMKQANDIASKKEMETEESLNNWTVEDLRSPEFEETIFQLVSNIEVMPEDESFSDNSDDQPSVDPDPTDPSDDPVDPE